MRIINASGVDINRADMLSALPSTYADVSVHQVNEYLCSHNCCFEHTSQYEGPLALFNAPKGLYLVIIRLQAPDGPVCHACYYNGEAGTLEDSAGRLVVEPHQRENKKQARKALRSMFTGSQGAEIVACYRFATKQFFLKTLVSTWRFETSSSTSTHETS